MQSEYQIKGTFPTEDDRKYLIQNGYKYNDHIHAWHGAKYISAPMGMICTRLPNVGMSDIDYANEHESQDQMCYDHSVREW